MTDLSLTQLIKNEHVDLIHNEAEQQLIATYTGFVRSEMFKEAIDKISSVCANNRIKSLVVNSLNQGPLSPSDNEYAGRSLPFLSENGLRYMAFVMPQHVITAMGVKRFSKLNKTEIQLGHFTDPNEALEWIRTSVNSNE